MTHPTGDGFGQFPRTESIWSMVQRVQAGEQAQAMLQELLRRYWPPLKAHLVIKKRLKSDEAEDLLQSFVADKILRLGLIERANLSKGRFRSFLLTALDRYLIDDRRKRRVDATSLDEAEFDPAAAEPAEASAFNTAWAGQLISLATDRMRQECRSSGRGDVWGIFETRCLAPILNQADETSYDELVARFGLQSPAHASNLLITAKRMFKRAMEAVVAEYEPGDAEIREELESLKEILGQAGAGRGGGSVSGGKS